MLTITDPKPQDTEVIESSMTDRERQALRIKFGQSATDEMIDCLFRSTKAFTVMSDSQPVLMFGVTVSDENPNQGDLWFIGSQAYYTEDPVTFARDTYDFIPELAEGYEVLRAVTDSTDRATNRWVRFMGFEKIPSDSTHNNFYSLRI